MTGIDTDPTPTNQNVAPKKSRDRILHQKKYVRLMTTKKKMQIPNLPLKIKEKLSEKAISKIFKNHKMYVIPKENTAKL